MSAPYLLEESADSLSMRAGQLACACGPTGAADAGVSIKILWKPALGFGLSVLAQAMVLSVLPDASRLLAPTEAHIGWPFALLLIGAALASFPAAFLIDAFGRRAAFALGASLGIAGGFLAYHAVAKASFPLLCLGVFWLGLAQGFALFYRHVSAMGGAGGAIVFAGGGLAALLAPTILTALGGGAGPTLIGAAAIYVVALGVAAQLPHGFAQRTLETPARVGSHVLTATLAGAIAWFLMSGAMLRGPLSLTACSATPSFIGGAVAWHLLAMYAPAALIARRPAMLSDSIIIGAGMTMMFVAAWLLSMSKPEILTGALISAGLGWSLVNVGALRLLHGRGPVSRLALAGHDLCLLSAAAAGALLI